jgi:hypothetical protein
MIVRSTSSKESSMRDTVLSTARPLTAILVMLLASPPAFARTVRCESKEFRYRYCSVKTYGDVQLTRERSHSACRYGRTWGYDQRGIWVDRGCRADFAVDEGRHGSSRYGRYDYYHHDDDHDSSKGAAIAAGAVGAAAIVAAIINSRNKKKNESDDDVPSWLVGRFEGYNTQEHTDVDLEVSPSGAVSGRVPGGDSFYGVYDDGRIEIAGTKYEVERKGSGFILTQAGNADNVIVYHRDK